MREFRHFLSVETGKEVICSLILVTCEKLGSLKENDLFIFIPFFFCLYV